MKTYQQSNSRQRQILIVCVSALLISANFTGPRVRAALPLAPAAPQADDPSAPSEPVKLIFVHHSTGGNWLADVDAYDNYAGGLGRELMNNNYYVSATNYGWTAGGEGIGDNTDIGHWWTWFRSANRDTYMSALYNETGQNLGDYGAWPRLAEDPGGENEIIMFKSCFPNSHLGGNPGDAPTTGDNPLRGQDAWSGDSVHNVANAKGIYNDILEYFATRQDKLFIVITAPPLLQDDGDQPTDAAHAANARAFNDWLVNDWLDGYAHDNVAVFDFYNVLTSNGGDPNSNDAGAESGNHHRWWNGAVQHTHPVDNNFSSYASDADSHPFSAGGQKATAEFVPLLNVFYNRWHSGASGGGTRTFNAVLSPGDATPPITYHWSPEPTSGQGTASATYQWSADGVYEITLQATNCGGTVTDTHSVTIGTPRSPELMQGDPQQVEDSSNCCQSPELVQGLSWSPELVRGGPQQVEDSLLRLPPGETWAAQTTVVFQDGVSPSAGYDGTRDVILANDANDNANAGGVENLETFFGSGEEYRRSLMRWDISALPAGATINGATVELYRYGGAAVNSMQLALYRVTRDWTEGTGVDFWPAPSYVPDGATWLTATTGVAWTTPGGDYDATVLDQGTLPAGMGSAWVHLDATDAARAWVEGGQPNYGLLLRPLNGDGTFHYYHSRNAITATLRPRLVITYSTGSTPTAPTLDLTAPTGGVSWPVSSTQQIRWNTTGTVEQVNLYYSSDGFASSASIASAINNAGFYDWTTPGDATHTAQVRVESVLSPTSVYDVSGAFSLYATGSFSIYLPLALGNHVSAPSCTHPLSAVTIQPVATLSAKTLVAVSGMPDIQSEQILIDLCPSGVECANQPRRAWRK